MYSCDISCVCLHDSQVLSTCEDAIRCEMRFKLILNRMARTQRDMRECERGTVEIVSCRKKWQSKHAESLLSFAVANSMWMLMRRSNMKLHGAHTFEYSFRYYTFTFIIRCGMEFFSQTKPNQKKFISYWKHIPVWELNRLKCKEMFKSLQSQRIKIK